MLDRGGIFIRVQCKTGRIRNGSIAFATCSTNWNQGTRRTYHGEADVFAVYEPTTDTVYLVPVQDVGNKEAKLRLDPVTSVQRHIRWAHPYKYTGKPEVVTEESA